MLVFYTGWRALASLTETVVEDFILGLLWCVLEALLEGLFEYVLAALFDLCFRAVRAIFNLEFPNAVLAAIGYSLLGFAAGGLSLIYFPHPLVHPSRIHGVSLLVSPMINAPSSGPMSIQYDDLVVNHTTTNEGGFVAATAQITCV